MKLFQVLLNYSYFASFANCRRRHNWEPFILCFYFVIASFKGEFGVSSKYQLLAKEKALTKELKLVNEKTKAVKNKIKRLSDTSLDLELLDQQARKILGLIGEDELIVLKIRY